MRGLQVGPVNALHREAPQRLHRSYCASVFSVTLPRQHGFMEQSLAVWWVSHQGGEIIVCVVQSNPFMSLFNQNPDLVLINFFQLKTDFFHIVYSGYSFRFSISI